MAIPIALVALGLGTAAVVVASSGDDAAAPQDLVLVNVPQAFPPVAEPPPPRAAVPGMEWHAMQGGDLRVEAMAHSPRFPAAPPGDTRFELGTVVDLAPLRGKSFKVFCDVYLEDTSVGMQLVELTRLIRDALEHGRKDRPDTVPVLQNTAWGERIVTRFTLQHGMAIVSPGSTITKQLPTQLPTVGAPPRFIGKDCNTIEKPRSDVEELLRGWGIGDPRAFYGYDTAKCKESGQAYKERKDWATGKKYRARYNLRLEGKGSRVILTAEVARIPFVQLLSWRAFWGVN
jgi:hypothetical protein